MLKDYKKWLNTNKTKIEVYDHINLRYFMRPLTIKEEAVINKKLVLEQIEE